MPDSLQAIVQLVSILLVFVIVLVMAYFASRWVAGYQRARGAGGNIELIETYRLATNQFIALVRIGSRYFALAVGKDKASFLTELSADDIKKSAAGETAPKSFREVLGRLKAEKTDRGAD